MKKKLVSVLFLLFAVSFATNAGTNINAIRLILCFKKPINTSQFSMESGYQTFGIKELDKLNKQFQCNLIKPLNRNKNLFVLQFDTKEKVKDIIEQYNLLGLFKYIESDHIGKAFGAQSISPNDSLFSRQWGLYNDGSFLVGNPKIGADIHMEDAWQIQQGSNKVIVAICDGGSTLTQPDFNGRWWINSGEIPGNGKDDDGDGYIDNLNGWDFVNNDNDPSDDNGHGTNVTTIIAANGNNNIGYAGVDWNCKIIANKVLDQNGLGYYSNWIAAIYYSIYHDARVINMSFGGIDTSQALKEAIMYADTENVVMVASMGNDDTDQLVYPAAYLTVIAVGATNPDDTRCNPFSWGGKSGSNYGAYISVVAPGNYIYGYSYLSNKDYDIFWSGTSQAAPFVSGLASLLIAEHPTYTAAAIKSLIQSTADDQVGNPLEDTKGWDPYYGYGRINAARALGRAAGVEDPIPSINNIKLWPNPSSGIFELDFVLQYYQNLIVEISDLQGRILETKNLGKQIPGQYHEFISTNLPQGIYFVTLKDSKYISIPKKLVIQ